MRCTLIGGFGAGEKNMIYILERRRKSTLASVWSRGQQESYRRGLGKGDCALEW